MFHWRLTDADPSRHSTTACAPWHTYPEAAPPITVSPPPTNAWKRGATYCGPSGEHALKYANRAPLTRKRHIPPHPAQPRHTNDWAPRTRKRHQQEHRPQRPTERSDPTPHAKGRTGDCPGPCKGATTRRTVTRGGFEGSQLRVRNFVCETSRFELAAEFPPRNPGVSAKFSAHEGQFTVDCGVPLSKFKRTSGPETTWTLITGGVRQMGLPCICE